MSPRTHAVDPAAPNPPGRCGWVWRWSGAVLRCEEPAIPGGHLCADHLIETRKEPNE